jgi:hypothetical protein
MTFQNALLQTVWNDHVRDAAVESENAPMATEPVATLGVLGRPREQQLAEAEASNEYVRLADLSGG